FFFSSRRRHTRLQGDWSSDVCSSDLMAQNRAIGEARGQIVILSDADTLFDPRFAAEIARAFGDPRVGVVTGQLTWTNPNESAVRSEERRVGKECRARWSGDLSKKTAR